MKIKCEKCKFEDIPENFSAYKYVSTVSDTAIEYIYIECPVCGNVAFFQHFALPAQKSISHLLIPNSDLASKPEEALKEYEEKLEKLKKRYLPDYERVNE